MPVSGFGGTCYEGAYEKTPNFEKSLMIYRSCENYLWENG